MMEQKHYFRVRYEKQGGHYHCRVFETTTYTGTWAKLGDLVVAESEWSQFQEALSGVEFKPEGEQSTSFPAEHRLHKGESEEGA